jgi:hypothetical protein
MSQTSYNILMPQAFPGMKADARFDVVESALAYLPIIFGRAVASNTGEADVHQPVLDKSILTFDSDFAVLNSIVITINGVACTTVTYHTDQAGTATALLAAIAAHPAVTAASKSANGRVYTIETKGIAITTVGVCTGGSTIPVATADYTTGANETFRGIAVHRHMQTATINAGAAYAKNDVVDVLRRGKIWVEVTIPVTTDEPVYVDVVNGIGKFTSASTTGNIATGGYFRSNSADNDSDLALVEINLP